MTIPAYRHTELEFQRRFVLWLLATSAAVSLAIAFAGIILGLRINTTASEPVGIWQIVPLDRSVEIADTIFICPRLTPAIIVGVERGYLRSGLCPGGFGPLIKTVVAVGGQRVQIARDLIVEGAHVANSAVAERDGQGRPLRAYGGGILPHGTVFLHSPFPWSWDSRYFGPVSTEGVLGLAREVITYAP